MQAKKEMTTDQRIAELLRGRMRDSYCDDCLANEVATPFQRSKRQQAKMRGELGILRGDDICIRCGDRKPVTTMAIA